MREQVKQKIDDLVVDMVAKKNKFPQSNDYDMHGFSRAYLESGPLGLGGKPDPNDGNRIHYPDTWKLPNHPSFSNESQYAVGPGFPEWRQYIHGRRMDNPLPEEATAHLPPGSVGWQLEHPDGRVVMYDTPQLQGPTDRSILEAPRPNGLSIFER
jgi:hypothetical protein